MKKRTFDIDNEKDTYQLHEIIEDLICQNASDSEVIHAMIRIYESSSLFTVIGFAEQVIYG